jgi:hypothetical protein
MRNAVCIDYFSVLERHATRPTDARIGPAAIDA